MNTKIAADSVHIDSFQPLTKDKFYAEIRTNTRGSNSISGSLAVKRKGVCFFVYQIDLHLWIPRSNEEYLPLLRFIKLVPFSNLAEIKPYILSAINSSLKESND